MEVIREVTDKDIIGLEEKSKRQPKISARAVLFDETGNIALMHVKKKYAYTFPGGGIEEKETITEGLLREILEETGCNCEILCKIGIISENRAQHDFTQISHYYLAYVVGNKGKANLTKSELENANEVIWLSPKECISTITNQVPINYQFSFIKERDLAIFNYLLNVESESRSIYERMIHNERNVENARVVISNT